MLCNARYFYCRDETRDDTVPIRWRDCLTAACFQIRVVGVILAEIIERTWRLVGVLEIKSHGIVVNMVASGLAVLLATGLGLEIYFIDRWYQFRHFLCFS